MIQAAFHSHIADIALGDNVVRPDSRCRLVQPRQDQIRRRKIRISSFGNLRHDSQDNPGNVQHPVDQTADQERKRKHKGTDTQRGFPTAFFNRD